MVIIYAFFAVYVIFYFVFAHVKQALPAAYIVVYAGDFHCDIRSGCYVRRQRFFVLINIVCVQNSVYRGNNVDFAVVHTLVYERKVVTERNGVYVALFVVSAINHRVNIVDQTYSFRLGDLKGVIGRLFDGKFYHERTVIGVVVSKICTFGVEENIIGVRYYRSYGKRVLACVYSFFQPSAAGYADYFENSRAAPYRFGCNRTSVRPYSHEIVVKVIEFVAVFVAVVLDGIHLYAVFKTYFNLVQGKSYFVSFFACGVVVGVVTVGFCVNFKYVFARFDNFGSRFVFFFALNGSFADIRSVTDNVHA